MQKCLMVVVVVSLALVASCASLSNMGLDASNPAVKQVVIAQTQHALAKEGLEVSAKEISVWYDTVAAIPALEAFAREVEKNNAISNRASEIINEYLGAIQPVEKDLVPPIPGE